MSFCAFIGICLRACILLHGKELFFSLQRSKLKFLSVNGAFPYLPVENLTRHTRQSRDSSGHLHKLWYDQTCVAIP